METNTLGRIIGHEVAGSIPGTGTGSTQPREDIWIAT